MSLLPSETARKCSETVPDRYQKGLLADKKVLLTFYSVDFSGFSAALPYKQQTRQKRPYLLIPPPVGDFRNSAGVSRGQRLSTVTLSRTVPMVAHAVGR